MLYDKDFLLELDKSKNKIIYAKITALTFDENPIQTIEGRVTQGSINIDGASAVRRTCSFTIVGQDFDYNNYYWGLNTKFKLEVGVQNFINPDYPDIIWFKQGIYLITGFNTSRSTSNFSISISGKDKMCLLNGEVGGSLESSVDFGTIEEEVDNHWVIRKIPIFEIIKNAVHVYGGEPYHNIIINDLDTYGKELLEYRLNTPAYLYSSTNGNSNSYDNIILDGNRKFYYKKDGDSATAVAPLKNISLDKFDSLVDSSLIDVHSEYLFSETEFGPWFHMAVINFGDTIGYRITDLIFAGDLIANVGESITSVLDKITNMLVEFEYFYNLDGQFVFQKKKNYISTMWGPEKSEEDQKPQYSYSLGNADYIFSGGELITTFNNNPNLLNLRNDFSIWGERTTTGGVKIPIHIRYAIDNKPIYYKTIKIDCENNEKDAQLIIDYNKKYNTNLKGKDSEIYLTQANETYPEAKIVDWREIIYQMALDYYSYNWLDDFELRISQENPDFYPTGRTGYEQYYIDLQGFWRDIYNLNPKEEERENFYLDGDRKGWNKIIYETPHNLSFWFDFLDTQGELKQFGIKSIGNRPKSIKDTNVKSIYFRDTPEIQFVEKAFGEAAMPGMQLIQIPKAYGNIFSISTQGKSAKERLDELLYQHGYCIESITINAIPIYYLDPNSRIYVDDKDSGINGYYNVSKITLPLTYNGTMSLTATKAQDSWI